MIVPICLFSGLTNYGTQTLSTIHVAYLVLRLYKHHILDSLDLSIPSASISRTVFLLCPTATFYSNNVSILNCCSHPMTNRIVVDCFYFTQAITLSLLVYFNSNLQCLQANLSTPADYHRVQRFIVI